MSRFKRLFLALAFVGLPVSRALAWQFGGTSPHGHTSQSDGGVLVNPKITGGDITLSTVTIGNTSAVGSPYRLQFFNKLGSGSYNEISFDLNAFGSLSNMAKIRVSPVTGVVTGAYQGLAIDGSGGDTMPVVFNLYGLGIKAEPAASDGSETLLVGGGAKFKGAVVFSSASYVNAVAGGTSSLTGGSPVTLTWTELTDRNSEFLTSTFTAKTAGVYHFTAQVLVSCTSDASAPTTFRVNLVRCLTSACTPSNITAAAVEMPVKAATEYQTITLNAYDSAIVNHAYWITVDKVGVDNCAGEQVENNALNGNDTRFSVEYIP